MQNENRCVFSSVISVGEHRGKARIFARRTAQLPRV